jgi:flagellar biosynthetic protein FliP
MWGWMRHAVQCDGQNLDEQSDKAIHHAWLRVSRLALVLVAGLSAASAFAAEPGLTVFAQSAGNLTIPASSLSFLIALPFLPALLLSMSAFVRMAVVFFLLRHALGSQYAPPNLVLAGLALLLAYFVMYPTVQKIQQEAYLPYTQGKISATQAGDRAALPLKAFMVRQTRAEDLALFTGDRKVSKVTDPNAVPLHELAPAFLISELKTAFQIAFMVILPFLVIDLVVSSVLMSLGMVMVPPQLVSLPLKLLLFVVADGWHLLTGSLIGSF